MNSSTTSYFGKKGETVCRPTDWTDIAKFILLNYGLHAVTVLTKPGDSSFIIFYRTVTAIFLPMTGVSRSLISIFQYARGEKDSLTVALGSGALCMVLPGPYTNKKLVEVKTALTEIHGQHPVPVKSFLDLFSLRKKSKPPLESHLVMVPQELEVVSLLPYNTDDGEKEITQASKMKLSCNYSALKFIAAIIQTLYSSFNLYRVSRKQVGKFGYASYSLTVIPYVLMSLLNMIACLCAPNYPRMFIVKYGGPRLDTPANKSNSGGPQVLEETDIIDTTILEQDIIAMASLEQDILMAIQNLPHFGSRTREEILTAIRSSPDFRNRTRHIKTSKILELEKCISGEVGIAYGILPQLSEPTVLDIEQLEPQNRTTQLTAIKDYYYSLMGDNFHLPLNTNKYTSNPFEGVAVPYLWTKWGRGKKSIGILVYANLCIIWLAGPYVIIHLLTNFEKAQSTLSQRGWVMAWIVCSQMLVLAPEILPGTVDDSILKLVLEFLLLRGTKNGRFNPPEFPGSKFLFEIIKITTSKPMRAIEVYLLAIVRLSLGLVAAVGGFVVVIRMMLDDEVCMTI